MRCAMCAAWGRNAFHTPSSNLAVAPRPICPARPFPPPKTPSTPHRPAARPPYSPARACRARCATQQGGPRFASESKAAGASRKKGEQGQTAARAAQEARCGPIPSACPPAELSGHVDIEKTQQALRPVSKGPGGKIHKPAAEYAHSRGDRDAAHRCTPAHAPKPQWAVTGREICAMQATASNNPAMAQPGVQNRGPRTMASGAGQFK